MKIWFIKLFFIPIVLFLCFFNWLYNTLTCMQADRRSNSHHLWFLEAFYQITFSTQWNIILSNYIGLRVFNFIFLFSNCGYKKYGTVKMPGPILSANSPHLLNCSSPYTSIYHFTFNKKIKIKLIDLFQKLRCTSTVYLLSFTWPVLLFQIFASRGRLLIFIN